MGIFFNYNSKLYNEGTAVIGADNRSLRYGDGLFETIKIKNGKLIFEEEHFDRLWNGLNLLDFEIPKYFTKEKLTEEILALAKKNNHSVRARVRLNVFRGDGGLYDAVNLFPNYIIQTYPLAEESGQWNANGLVVGIYNEAKKSCDTFSNLKSNNYLPFAMAALHAKKQKWNDAIVLNTFNRVCESTIANIFLIKNEILYTPALSEGCVAGIMRKILIKIITEAGYKIIEKEISVDELLNAEEIFLANSIQHIRWVQSIRDRSFRNEITQKIYQAVIPFIQ